MCHSKMEIDFHENVTFVTGENGSGKSAVLTALQVCLGSKASATNRGASIKDLIKSGKQKAVITIHMRNTGKDAYKPHIYGKEIIVTRRIDKNSGSSYQIKSTDGKVIAKTSKELRMILDQFNVHIDNPTTVMTQDISRQFLASKKPTAKYQFFLKATQLQKMMEEFEQIKQNKNAFQTALEAKTEALEESLKQVQRLEEEANAAKELEVMDNRKSYLENMLLWAHAWEAQEKKKHFEEKEAAQQASLDKLQKQQREKQAEMNAESDKANTLREELSQLNERFQLLQRDTSETQGKITELARKDREVRGKIEEYEQRIKSCRHAIKSTEKIIQDLKKRSQIDRSAQNREVEDRIERLNTTLSELQEKLKHEQSLLPDLNKELDQHRDNEDSLREEKKNEQTNISQYEQQKSRYQSEEKDKFRYFEDGGRNVRQVLQLIADHQNSFERIPIGPIGLLIEPKDLKWAPAIEEALKNGLQNFYFHSKKDFETFGRLMRQERQRPWAGIIQRFSNQRYSINLPDGFTTIYDQLQLDMTTISKLPIKYDIQELDASLFNIMVDQSGIESSILIETREEAQRAMFGGSYPPKYVSDCFLPNGTRLFKKGTSENIQAKNKTYSELWAKSYDAQIQELTNQINQTQERVRKINEEGRHVFQQRKVSEEKVARVRGEIDKLQRQISRLTTEKKRLESDLNAQLQAQEEDFSGEIMENENLITTKQRDIEGFEQKIQKIQVGSGSVLSGMDELKEELHKKQRAEASLRREIDEKRVTLQKQIEHVALCKKFVDRFEEASRDAREALITLQARVQEYDTRYQTAYKFASGRCEPIDTEGKTAEMIDREIRRLNTMFEHQLSRFGGMSINDVIENYQKHLRAYNDRKDALDLSSKALEKIREGLNERYRKWKQIRSDFSKMTSHFFNAYMSQKGHSGKLLFDHEEGTLDLEISLQKNATNGQTVSDAKSLSGGERSFSTVCFVLSLWEVVESPLRALDEFDIFMDAVYRKKAIEMILSKATSVHRRRQLILISPHDTSQIGTIDKRTMKVFRMPNPNRTENQHLMDEFLQRHQV